MKTWYTIFIAGCASILLTISGPASADLEDGLMAYWNFDGNADDISGNGNDGNVLGPTLTTDRLGKADSAYHFDGINDYIDIGNGVKPPFPFTIGLWLKSEDLSTGAVFTNDDVDNDGDRDGATLYASSKATSQIFEGFSAPQNRVSYTSVDTVFNINEWHHFAVVFNALRDRVIYIDGLPVEGAYSGTGSSLTYSSGNGRIGTTRRGGAWELQFLGDIDNVTVHNRALSAAEIIELMNLGQNTDLPDLVGSVDSYSLLNQGTFVDLVLIVENQGNQPSGPFVVGLIGANREVIDFASDPGLGVAESRSIPLGGSPVTPLVGVRARTFIDVQRAVEESNESNNTNVMFVR